MKTKLITVLSLLFAVFATGTSTFAAGGDVWQIVPNESVRVRNSLAIDGDKFLVYRFNAAAAKAILSDAPMEFSDDARQRVFVFTLPMPDGKFESFRVVNSPVLSPALQAEYPDWQTYQAYGIDDPTATARFGITLNGFHASVFSTKGTVVIDPIAIGDTRNYIVYSKPDLTNPRKFHCLLDETLSGHSDTKYSFFPAPEFSHGAQIRTYRLAVAATGEYTAVFGSQAAGLAQVTTTANRMNGIYREDFAVGLQLVSGTNLVYPNAATDPYTNVINDAQLTANQTNIDTVIGSGAYDVGHLFATSNNGLAQLSSICGAGKARGASGQPNPQGDGFDVDYVAHEIGHQISANHTFNSDPNCGSGSTNARKEPGSGVTIMSYAGICGSTANLQRNSIDNFLGHSQQEAITFLGGTGGTCGTLAGANAIPVVTSPGASFSIPFNTPYALTASATDGNGNPLTYSWEHDTASGGLTSNYPATTDDDDINLGASRVLMRPYSPSSSPTRTFPSLTYILNNANEAPLTYTGTSATGSVCAATCITGEDLPSVARTINYRVTVRDGEGGVADATTAVTFVNTTTPFTVTSQNTSVTYTGNSAQTVTWNVSGTTAAPISTANVKISLSTDGGQTFPNVLAASTPNDGTETVTITNTATTTARIKVEAVGNIFFDINNANFTITASAVNRKPFDFDGDGKDDVSVYRNGIWYLLRSQLGFSAVNWGLPTDKTVAGDYDGDGKADTAVFRDGAWIILNSSNGAVSIINWGLAGDIPMVGDYDGDNKTDLTVFRSGVWYILQSSNGGFVFASFGLATDKPVVGKFDTDNKSDIAVFRNGNWYILGSLSGFSAVGWGTTGDVAVPGDYDGDGRTDVAVFRGGNWYILGSSAGFSAVGWGLGTDTAVPADYDGDGKTDVAVFRNGNWYILQSSNGAFSAVGFGTTGDKPIPAQLQ